MTGRPADFVPRGRPRADPARPRRLRRARRRLRARRRRSAGASATTPRRGRCGCRRSVPSCRARTTRGATCSPVPDAPAADPPSGRDPFLGGIRPGIRDDSRPETIPAQKVVPCRTPSAGAGGDRPVVRAQRDRARARRVGRDLDRLAAAVRPGVDAVGRAVGRARRPRPGRCCSSPRRSWARPRTRAAHARCRSRRSPSRDCSRVPSTLPLSVDTCSGPDDVGEPDRAVVGVERQRRRSMPATETEPSSLLIDELEVAGHAELVVDPAEVGAEVRARAVQLQHAADDLAGLAGRPQPVADLGAHLDRVAVGRLDVDRAGRAGDVQRG